MKRATIVFQFLFIFPVAAGWSSAETQAPKVAQVAKGGAEIHNRKDFDTYLAKFNSCDYAGFLDYFADKFEMIHVGGDLRSREEVMKFYSFLHRYVKETVTVDRLVMDSNTIAMEARVRIEGINELTPEVVAASHYPRLKPLKVGEVAIIPQFIHYHLVNGKIVKVECRE